MRDDRGAATAEVAVALPIVALVLVACLGGLLAGTELVRLQSAAADAARLLGRGESSVLEHVQQVVPGATVLVSRSDGLVCVEARSAPRVLGVPVEVSASSCALDGASLITSALGFKVRRFPYQNTYRKCTEQLTVCTCA